MTSSELDALFATAGYPRVHPSLVQPTPELAAAVPVTLARRYDLLPVLFTSTGEGRTLWIAMADPADDAAIAACAASSGLRVRTMSAPAEELRASLHRWYGGPAPKPAAPPPRRPKSILELEAVSVEEPTTTSPPRRSPAVVVVQAPTAMAEACRHAVGADVSVREVDLRGASAAVRDASPFAIVVPDDVYQFDPAAFSELALQSRTLLVTAEDALAAHLEPVLRTAYRSFF